MNKNVMPPKSQKDIEDFLTFLTQAKSNPEMDAQLSHLKSLEENLGATEDKPAKLAITIKQWCKQFGITLNREELAEYRANMLKKNQAIPKPTEGEKPEAIYNKALLVKEVNEAMSQKSP